MTTSSRPAIKTMANLEAAFAGESMAHIKYRYFAKLAREAGDEETARTFEATADQEVMHAFGHLDLLYPKSSMTPAKALQIAIDGETYEYTEMYPGFRQTAEAEGNAAAVAERKASGGCFGCTPEQLAAQGPISHLDCRHHGKNASDADRMRRVAGSGPERLSPPGQTLRSTRR